MDGPGVEEKVVLACLLHDLYAFDPPYGWDASPFGAHVARDHLPDQVPVSLPRTAA